MSGQEVEQKVFLSERAPQSILSGMQSSTRKIIATLELLAAVMAVDLLRPFLRARCVFFFVDNEASRANLISMSSHVEVHCRLLKFLPQCIICGSISMGISRVPSASNVADGPSRSEFGSV